jgi:hypothetical protein
VRFAPTVRSYAAAVVSLPTGVTLVGSWRRHPKKEVEEALAYADESGWRVVESEGGGHYGRILCPERSREGCSRSVWSTPRNPGAHARQLRRAIDRCPHSEEVGA